ncbi:MAG: hypothetical protein GX581_07375 [Syntrophomonadaceae bacterium]|jgi:hypothetical protein|nr:hypothetical protein [Syntrophomonadaceae bacterium]
MDKNSIERLLLFIKSSKDIISNEAYSEVWHYYEHEEYEMAFEGLLIEFIQEDKYPRDFEKAEWKTLGIEFGLDNNSVFDPDIWNKFISWIK